MDKATRSDLDPGLKSHISYLISHIYVVWRKFLNLRAENCIKNAAPRGKNIVPQGLTVVPQGLTIVPQVKKLVLHQ
jgi:hypothetical protein